MSPDIKCKTCIISFILLISSLSFFAISPSSVKAQGDTAETLYFSTVNLTEYYETYLPAEMTPTLTDFENAKMEPTNNIDCSFCGIHFDSKNTGVIASGRKYILAFLFISFTCFLEVIPKLVKIVFNLFY